MFDVSVEMLCNLKDCGWEIADYSVCKNPCNLIFRNGNRVVQIDYTGPRGEYMLHTYFCSRPGNPMLTYEDMFIFTKLMNELEVKALDKRRAALKEASKCILQK